MSNLRACLWIAAAIHSTNLVLAAEVPSTITIQVALKNGNTYSLREFCQESNKKLRTTYDLENIPDRMIEIDDHEKALLKSLSSFSALQGKFKVEFGKESLTVIVPNSENPEVRQAMRRSIESAFGLNSSEWSPEMGLKRPQNLDANNRTVVLIHGLGGGHQTWTEFEKPLASLKVQVLHFYFPNEGSLASAGERLRRELSELANEFPRLRLTLLAHSSGGLVARWALEKGKSPSCVTNLFMIGTPQQGSELARVYPLLSAFRDFAQSSNSDARFKNGFGEAVEDLHANSHFLRELNDGKRPKEVRYHIAYGTRGIVSAEEHAILLNKFDKFLEERDVALLKRSAWIGLLRSANEIIDQKGDGAVAISSALLADVESSKSFYLSHTELIDGTSIKGKNAVRDWILLTLNWEK